MSKKDKVFIKVHKSIEKVSDLIEKSLDLLNKKELDNVEKDLWQIAAELEYAASMISIIVGLGDFIPNIDVPNELELEDILILIKDDLAELNDLIDKNPKNAYERIRKVLRYTRLAQSKFEK